MQLMGMRAGRPGRNAKLRRRALDGGVRERGCGSDQPKRDGTAAFTHHQGCGQTPVDLARSTGRWSGWDGIPTWRRAPGRPRLRGVAFEEVRRRSRIREAGRMPRDPGGGRPGALRGARPSSGAGVGGRGIEDPAVLHPISDLVSPEVRRLGHDAGPLCDAGVGIASDMVVAAGGTSVLGEVTEFIGAEHILARHARRPRWRSASWPSSNGWKTGQIHGVRYARRPADGGNIKGGLTTIEEKSLGPSPRRAPPRSRRCTSTASRDGSGLVVMDSPGESPRSSPDLHRRCNLIAFATGEEPAGLSLRAGVKITENVVTWTKLRDHMDCYVEPSWKGQRPAERRRRLFGSWSSTPRQAHQGRDLGLQQFDGYLRDRPRDLSAC